MDTNQRAQTAILKVMKGFSFPDSGVIAGRTIVTAFAVLVIGFTAWVILRPNPNQQPQTTETNTTANSSNEERLASVVDNFCKNTFRTNAEKETGNLINKASMRSTVFNTRIQDTYARVVASCDSDEIPEDAKQPGFTAYIELKKDTWTLYSYQASTPPCDLFDNKNWPREIAGMCIDNGTERTIL